MHKYRYQYPVVSVNQHYSKGVGNSIVYTKEHVYARILFTNDQTKWTSTSFGCFSRSTAFIVDFTWEVNCTQMCNINVVGMVRCDWPFTVGYIIMCFIVNCWGSFCTVLSLIYSAFYVVVCLFLLILILVSLIHKYNNLFWTKNQLLGS